MPGWLVELTTVKRNIHVRAHFLMHLKGETKPAMLEFDKPILNPLTGYCTEKIRRLQIL